MRVAVSVLLLWVPQMALAGGAPKRNWEAVELVGQVSDYWFSRNWRSYYWREDFTFLLKEDATGKTWRIISREPTPAYIFRMGTTFSDVKVDWTAKPRVKVVGVKAIDRIPADFYDFKLDEPHLATALIVFVENDAKVWQEAFVNNWFHQWGENADKAIYSRYADKPAPYDIYGFARSQAAPFDQKSQAIIDKHRDNPSLMFHGRVKSAKGTPYGYEVELIDLVGRNVKSGGHVLLFGDGKTIPLLDNRNPPRFTDVSAGSGLKIADKTGVGGTNPHAVAVEDFDRDGLPDVVILTFGKPHVYYFKNLGKMKFEDRTKGSGLEGFEGAGTGAAIADFNRDGHLDLYVTSLRGGASRLFQGKGDGSFLDVSEKAGVLVKGAARSCAWSDVDRDGWPDLYVTRPDGANLLFRNKRDGTFTDIAKQSGVEIADRHSLGCVFGDVDDDGLDELFVTNYRSQVSTLFKNLGNGTFKDVTAVAGLERKASSVGCVLADVFNECRLDLYVSTDSWLSGANSTEEQLLKMKHTVESNLLYVNDGNGKFVPKADPVLLSKTLGHDVVIEDFDHDGFSEIYVGVDAESGNRWATTKGGNPLWKRTATGWKDVSTAWGVRHEANCVCVPAVDFDGDGDLDLLLINFYSQPVLYRNETNDKNWLRIRAVGAQSSRDGIGAKVKVFKSTSGPRRLVGYRQIHSGAGYCRCSPLEAHVGLGPQPVGSYRVEVTFPITGRTVVRDRIAPGQVLVVKEE